MAKIKCMYLKSLALLLDKKSVCDVGANVFSKHLNYEKIQWQITYIMCWYIQGKSHFEKCLNWIAMTTVMVTEVKPKAQLSAGKEFGIDGISGSWEMWWKGIMLVRNVECMLRIKINKNCVRWDFCYMKVVADAIVPKF